MYSDSPQDCSPAGRVTDRQMASDKTTAYQGSVLGPTVWDPNNFAVFARSDLVAPFVAESRHWFMF
jgi:hypothetical protein